MSSAPKDRPFILRSEVLDATTEDRSRRAAIISSLTDADLDRVAGGTNRPDYVPDWDPELSPDASVQADS
jgi:hypothetical protein